MKFPITNPWIKKYLSCSYVDEIALILGLLFFTGGLVHIGHLNAQIRELNEKEHELLEELAVQTAKTNEITQMRLDYVESIDTKLRQVLENQAKMQQDKGAKK